MSAWGGWTVEGKETSLKLLEFRRTVGDSLEELSGYSLATRVVVSSIAVAAMVATLAAFSALRARYPRRVLIAVSMLLLYGLALVLLAWAAKHGEAPDPLLLAIFSAVKWIAATALVCATIYLFWSGFAERALTARYACGAFVISAAFGAAWLMALRAAGAQPAITMLWPVLLPLIASALAPWSLNRIRHA